MHQKRRKDLLVVVTVYACNVSIPVLLISSKSSRRVKIAGISS